MSEITRSRYEGPGLPAVRPYLIVGDASAALDFYARAFEAEEVERFTTPAGGIAHVKLRIGESILEMGEHPDAVHRVVEPIPRIGLRLYVPDVDATYARASRAGASGEGPSDRPHQGVRGATVHDPFGVTWWLATPLP
jgi:PhnB protein